MLNKSVLHWTKVCQLQCKTQLHETIFANVTLEFKIKQKKLS
jgi:hypothetical protein